LSWRCGRWNGAGKRRRGSGWHSGLLPSWPARLARRAFDGVIDADESPELGRVGQCLAMDRRTRGLQRGPLSRGRRARGGPRLVAVASGLERRVGAGAVRSLRESACASHCLVEQGGWFRVRAPGFRDDAPCRSPLSRPAPVGHARCRLRSAVGQHVAAGHPADGLAQAERSARADAVARRGAWEVFGSRPIRRACSPAQLGGKPAAA